MKAEDISSLNQLVRILEDSSRRLKKAYQEKDTQNFNKLKKIIFQAQNIIFDIVK